MMELEGLWYILGQAQSYKANLNKVWKEKTSNKTKKAFFGSLFNGRWFE